MIGDEQVDFRTLNYVIAIAKHQNITKAAETLYVGQPTLSKFLMTLEQELGVRLFRRLGNKYMLTYAGERYVEKAAQILSLKSDLDAEMADILKRDVGVLNVAFANMRCSYMLPATLPAFRAEHPNVKVNVFEGTSDQNDRRLLEGQVDVAFYTHPGEENPLIEYHALASEELLICTCRDHPLAEKAVSNENSPYPKLELNMLKDELVLLMRPEQRTRQIVDSILHENRIHFDNILYTSNIQAIMGLVSSGYGVSFVFDSHLRHRIDDTPIDCYSFGNPCTRYDFVAATRKRSYLSRYVEDFIEIVRQAV